MCLKEIDDSFGWFVTEYEGPISTDHDMLSELDVKARPLVAAMNESGAVTTVHSCVGHDESWQDPKHPNEWRNEIGFLSRVEPNVFFCIIARFRLNIAQWSRHRIDIMLRFCSQEENEWIWWIMSNDDDTFERAIYEFVGIVSELVGDTKP